MTEGVVTAYEGRGIINYYQLYKIGNVAYLTLSFTTGQLLAEWTFANIPQEFAPAQQKRMVSTDADFTAITIDTDGALRVVNGANSNFIRIDTSYFIG